MFGFDPFRFAGFRLIGQAIMQPLIATSLHADFGTGTLENDHVLDALATAADVPFEIPAGFTFPGFYAAMASAYMHRYGMKPEHLMNVAIKNHDNASLNPYAQFGVTIQKWMEGRVAA